MLSKLLTSNSRIFARRTMFRPAAVRMFSDDTAVPAMDRITNLDEAAHKHPETLSHIEHKHTVSTTHTEERFLDQVQKYVDRAASMTQIQPDMLQYLMACDHVLRFQIPVKRDNGTIETFTCYRAQHKHHFMPVKGGTRYSSDITL
mmetsp:Transcript_33643/g.51897  ORF Transcript_33643/g.51897 Transcript_33643/m.51897 type:complete len:146 (+) Transcript_33643:46-483(+)